jgi:heme/copper-type cytochrome/quinol oxidase subunit 2
MDYITPICSVVAVFLAYFAISREGRDDLRATLQRTYRLVKKGVGWTGLLLALLLPLAIVAASINNFLQFNSSAEPITRHELVMLFLHFFNSVMYFGLFLIVLAVLSKARRELKEEAATKQSQSDSNVSE